MPYRELAMDLIKRDANIYISDEDGNPPTNEPKMIDLFNILWCATPLVKSMHVEDMDTFKRLLNNINTDVNQDIGEESWNILHAAVYLNRTEYIKLLIEKCCFQRSSYCRRSVRFPRNRHMDLEAQCNSSGLQTALHIACMKGYSDIVRLLGEAVLISTEIKRHDDH
jgi:ankyrin repeat protein